MRMLCRIRFLSRVRDRCGERFLVHSSICEKTNPGAAFQLALSSRDAKKAAALALCIPSFLPYFVFSKAIVTGDMWTIQFLCAACLINTEYFPTIPLGRSWRAWYCMAQYGHLQITKFLFDTFPVLSTSNAYIRNEVRDARRSGHADVAIDMASKCVDST